MAVTKTSLRASHPEWVDADDDVVDAAIAFAQNNLDETVLGDRYDDAVTLRACDNLARHPYARDMRLVNKDGTTTYQFDYERLIMAAGTAYRILP